MHHRLKIAEIFYSLQGEGARVGTPTVFIRASGCNTKYACYASGVKCDTEFESGKEMTVEQIYEWLQKNACQCKDITWTGGEPTDQLTEEIVSYFKTKGYFQAIETSGLNPVPKGIDYVCISPKVAEHVLKKNFPYKVNELRYVRHKGQTIPEPAVEADNYFISPHSDGMNINLDNLKHCIELCLQNGKWRLSVQNHKLWNIL
jgi:organic radical activating enzyme